MKVALALLFALVAVTAASRIRREKYTTKFDNIDIDSILKNDRLLNNYFKCLMDLGNCTPDAAELKKVIPDALQNGCIKCNDKQKHGVEKVLKHIIEHKPEEFALLEKKYDPEGVYKKKYQEQLEKKSIKA